MRIVLLLSLFLIAPLIAAGSLPAAAQSSEQPDPRTVPRFGGLSNESAIGVINEALNGNPVAQDFIGEVYAQGLGVEINMCVANLWFDKAARGGYPDSQLKLGHAYYWGIGVRVDHVLAYLWKSAALRQGTEFDRRALEEDILSSMSEEKRSEARARERTFDPAKMPPAELYILTSELNSELRALVGIGFREQEDSPTCGVSFQEIIDSGKRVRQYMRQR